MLSTGSADMYDEITDPRGHPPAPQGIRCRACGRIEPDPGARFCGVCGATLHQAAGSEHAADTVQLATAGRGYEPALPAYPPATAPAAAGAVGRGSPVV